MLPPRRSIWKRKTSIWKKRNNSTKLKLVGLFSFFFCLCVISPDFHFFYSICPSIAYVLANL